MPKVTINGVGDVNFPDSMTPDQIQEAIETHILPNAPHPSYAKTLLNAIPKGAAGLADSFLNAPENVVNLGKMAFGAGATALGRPDLAPDVTAPNNMAANAAKSVGITSAAAEPTNAVGRVIDMVGQTVGGGGINPMAAGRSLLRGQVLPVVRDVAAAGASGVGAGLGSELGSNVKTGNEAIDNAIHTAATLVGGAVPGSIVAARGTAGDRTAAALNGVTPEQMALAKALQERANAANNPLTGYEAVQAVTGMNPKMQTQQRVTEQSDAAAKGLTQMMQNRPEANRAQFNAVADSIAPAERFPDVLAGRLQSAAEKAITSAQEARSAASTPLYGAQRASDAEAMGLQEKLPTLESAMQDRLQARDAAVNVSGQLQGLQNDMTQTARDYHPVQGAPGFPARYLPHTDVAVQAGQGAADAMSVARQRLAEAKAAETQLNAASDALAQKNLPEIRQKVDGLLSDLDQQIKVLGPTVEGSHLKTLRDELAPGGEPIVYPSQLESVYRNSRNKLETGPFSTSEDRTRAGVLGPQVQALKSLINDVSPSIAEGRQKYADASRDIVEPLKLGQVGKLARSDDFRQQAATLLPEAPMDVNPAVIDRTTTTLRAQDPDIVRQFLAQHLRGTFNEANQSNIAGPNVYGGSKFAAKVAGNPTQADNLAQALRSAGADPQGLAGALDVFRAQGMKPAVNSATQANLAETNLMGGQKLADLLMRPLKTIPGAVDSWRNGWATKGLAEALAAPNSVERLEELARANGTYSPAQQQLLSNLLRATPTN